MKNQTDKPGENNGPQFVTGWFTASLNNGKRPVYGYRNDRLPEVASDFTMKVETGS